MYFFTVSWSFAYLHYIILLEICENTLAFKFDVCLLITLKVYKYILSTFFELLIILNISRIVHWQLIVVLQHFRQLTP
jgi:hypothetical protein